ncbi:MAG: 30S ribosomal protein S21 [Brucellaceae bacterium]|nr:30S ribosomal protein S21 [Brucellaceae bacterium]
MKCRPVRDKHDPRAARPEKKLQREGVFREMKARRAYEKPSEKRAREKGEAVRRNRRPQPARQRRDCCPARSVLRPGARAELWPRQRNWPALCHLSRGLVSDTVEAYMLSIDLACRTLFRRCFALLRSSSLKSTQTGCCLRGPRLWR